MDKIDSRTLPVDALNERRLRAVKLRMSGVPLKDVAVQCDLSRTTVIAAVKAYKAGGAKAVAIRRLGRKPGTCRLLTVDQEREVQRLIQDRTPDPLKMVYALWTRNAVAELIRERYGIDLAVRTVGLYLSRWGYTPQKPLKKAYEQSPAAVKQWLEQDYPAISRRAKAQGAEIHWGDESGLRSDDVRGRSYAPQGQTPVIRVPNRRHSLSIISSVTNKGQMRWKVFDGALNADILIDFLARLIKGASQKIFLVLDNLRVHHAKPVKTWLAKHAEAIEVFYLPSYSPELNPDEMANADLKQAVTKRAPARTKLQLIKATAHHLRSVQRQPERIKSYFQHLPVRYAA
ncbi:MAG: IS630 family transposase [Panacagrimonas sp.]